MSALDEKGEKLGLDVLDEPTAHQSDPSVLDLQLRAIHKDLKVSMLYIPISLWN